MPKKRAAKLVGHKVTICLVGEQNIPKMIPILH
jgi:hypothetical protein